MNLQQTMSLMQQLAGPFHRDLNEWEIRRWAEELKTADEATALAAMRRIHQTDEKFPSIARFLEVLKATRPPMVEGELVLLFDDGTKMAFDDYVDQQIRENAYWDSHPMPPEQAEANIRRLKLLITQGLSQ